MKISHLSKKIQKNSVLENISFEVNPGQIIGIIGRNGSGKTTLFRTIAGDYLPDCGEVWIDEKNIFKYPEKKEQLFYVDPQENFFKSYTLQQISEFYQLNFQQFRKQHFLELCESHHLDCQKRFRELSKGQQGLFLMILAVCSDARYLLLDEPFDGLDVIVRKEVIRLLLQEMAESQRSILISSHNLTELESIVERVLILKDKKMVQDYDLDILREQAKKYQFVFADRKMPGFIREHGKIIEVQGRVLIVLFEQMTEEIEEAIQTAQPIFYEELPLALEDVFTTQLVNAELEGSIGK